LRLQTPLSYFHNGFAKDLDSVVDFYEGIRPGKDARLPYP
jgi:cytochrome c peroxidase